LCGKEPVPQWFGTESGAAEKTKGQDHPGQEKTKGQDHPDHEKTTNLDHPDHEKTKGHDHPGHRPILQDDPRRTLLSQTLSTTLTQHKLQFRAAT
jgi:hypothetical protein